MEKILPNYKKRLQQARNIWVVSAPGIKEAASFSVNRHGIYAEKLAEHFCRTGERLKNYYEYTDTYAIINVYRKKDKTYHKIFIDISDVERCKSYAWCIIDGNNSRTMYAQTTNLNTGGCIKMHRFILNSEHNDNEIIDHINGNGLDNRSSNLRRVDAKSNSLNRTRLNSNNTSGMNGIYRLKNENSWKVEWIDRNTGKKKSKNFNDKKFTGIENSLEAAKQFRDAMITENYESYIDDNTIIK